MIVRNHGAIYPGGAAASLVLALLFRIVSPACRLSWSSFFPLDTYVERPRKAHLYVLTWLPLTPLVLFISSVHHVRDFFFVSDRSPALFGVRNKSQNHTGTQNCASGALRDYRYCS